MYNQEQVDAHVQERLEVLKKYIPLDYTQESLLKINLELMYIKGNRQALEDSNRLWTKSLESLDED